jgi:hypothetical protein
MEIMSELAATKQWQRNRALALHAEFMALANRLHHERSGLMRELKAVAKMLNGRQIVARVRGDRMTYKTLHCSAKTLYREWRRWNDGEHQPTALLLNYKAGQEKIPAALIAEIQRRATLKMGGRNAHGLAPLSKVYDWLRSDFAARLDIPGINYDEFPAGAEFPYSVGAIYAHAPGKAERALGNRGVAAFKQLAAHVTMDYSKLRKSELFTLDDVRLDLLCVNFDGKVVEAKCYILMEVASRSIVAFFLKPKDAIKNEDVDELIAHGLQTPGFGLGVGYVTYIKFERGKVACGNAAQAALEGVTNGRIKIIRTGMNGGVTCIGAARDRASGNSAGKAVIEAFMRRLHFALLHLPGQIGNSHDNTPASVGYGSNTPGTLVYEVARLARFERDFNHSGKGRLRLQLPMLRLHELQQAVREAIDKHNHEPGHDYADHGSFTQAEVEPGVWKETP